MTIIEYDYRKSIFLQDSCALYLKTKKVKVSQTESKIVNPNNNYGT